MPLNKPEIIIITPEQQGIRLDLFLTQINKNFPSRSFAAKLITNKNILVNGMLKKPSYKIEINDKIEIDWSFLEQENETPVGEKIPLNILFEDEHILVIDKPVGMVVHPGAGVHSGTLVNAILSHCGQTLPSLGGPQRAGIVHRLDRDTSGVLVAAKSQLALTNLSKDFASHVQKRIYQALVYGNMTPIEGNIETWHGRDPKNRIKYAVQEEGIGKKASLKYKVTEQFPCMLASLVECQLFTGRTHQIRVQLTHKHHGLLGDQLYGQLPGKIKNDKVLFAFINHNIKRQMLHASFLGFNHPVTKVHVEFQSPLPSDFQTALNFLRTYHAI